MPHTNKAKSSGVSASSFFDLKAELAKHEEEFKKNKAQGKSTPLAGNLAKPNKKPTVWARSNKGVKGRAVRDVELEEISKVTVESARAALERKAKIYDKLRKGKSGGLSDKQYDALLVDFDQDPDGDYESDSDDVDESLTVPTKPDDDDPMVEYEDEFGRIRTGRRSDIPRHLLPPEHPEPDDDDEDVIVNPVNYFPVYEPSADRIQAVNEAFAEANNPLDVHFDASQEVRAKGAGFYQFSADEETRKQQMDELKSARVETEKTRQEFGATDLRPGEVEGMREGEGGKAGGSSRAMEKRKRDIEERRRLLEAKRRKIKGDEAPSGFVENHKAATPVDSTKESRDPFASLEKQAKGKDKARNVPPQNAADDFLARLEQDMLNGK